MKQHEIFKGHLSYKPINTIEVTPEDFNAWVEFHEHLFSEARVGYVTLTVRVEPTPEAAAAGAKEGRYSKTVNYDVKRLRNPHRIRERRIEARMKAIRAAREFSEFAAARHAEKVTRDSAVRAKHEMERMRGWADFDAWNWDACDDLEVQGKLNLLAKQREQAERARRELERRNEEIRETKRALVEYAVRQFVQDDELAAVIMSGAQRRRSAIGGAYVE